MVMRLVLGTPDTTAVLCLCYSNTWLENQNLQLETLATYRDLFMVMLWTKQPVFRDVAVKKVTRMQGPPGPYLDHADASSMQVSSCAELGTSLRQTARDFCWPIPQVY